NSVHNNIMGAFPCKSNRKAKTTMYKSNQPGTAALVALLSIRTKKEIYCSPVLRIRGRGDSNKEVAKVNFPMHEAHCKRFLCLCPDCGDSVHKDQLEEHKVEQHTVVRCQSCNEKMERCKLSDHETNECKERLQSCEFCELELPLSALKDHTLTCGSRTERCPDCRQYVTLKDKTAHALICSSALYEDDDSKKEELVYENLSGVPEDNLQDDLKFGAYLTFDRNDLKDDLSQAFLHDEFEEPSDFSFLTHKKKEKGGGAAAFGDWNQINTCPNCHLALPQLTLQWHMVHNYSVLMWHHMQKFGHPVKWRFVGS
ncbi:hypothetical protein NFI96_014073, partial [Prochilodus magdalenae]